MGLLSNSIAFLLSVAVVVILALFIAIALMPANPAEKSSAQGLQTAGSTQANKTAIPKIHQGSLSSNASTEIPQNISSDSTQQQNLWYFAYGSNLYRPGMESRVGNWSKAMPATLYGYSRVFASRAKGGSAYANILKSENSKVEGALYLISPSAAEKLDRYEGVPTAYVRISITATSGGKNISAYAYQYASPGYLAKPSQQYLFSITEGLRSFGYGNETISEVIAQAKNSQDG